MHPSPQRTALFALWACLVATTLSLGAVFGPTPARADDRVTQEIGPSRPQYGPPADSFGFDFGKHFAQPGAATIVPILMYHHVRYLAPAANRMWRGLTVDPAAFEVQMAYLVEHGYHTISFSDLADYFDRGKSLPDKPVILTFDDGWREQYTTVFPILRRYGLVATFFPPTQWVGNSSLTLTWAQIEEMSLAGMEFGSHTVNHHILPKETPDEVRRQLTQSKATLEQHTHKPVIALAYPTGAYSPAVVAWVPEAGYRAAVGIFPGVEQGRPTGSCFAVCRSAMAHRSKRSLPACCRLLQPLLIHSGTLKRPPASEEAGGLFPGKQNGTEGPPDPHP